MHDAFSENNWCSFRLLSFTLKVFKIARLQVSENFTFIQNLVRCIIVMSFFCKGGHIDYKCCSILTLASFLLNSAQKKRVKLPVTCIHTVGEYFLRINVFNSIDNYFQRGHGPTKIYFILEANLLAASSSIYISYIVIYYI